MASLARGKIDRRLGFAASPAARGEAALSTEALERLARPQRRVREAISMRAAARRRRADRPRRARRRRSRGRGPAGRGDRGDARGAAELAASRARGRETRAHAPRARRQDPHPLAALAPLVPQAIAAYEERLAAKLREALGGTDEERIRQEIAVHGVRIDVAEELSRLAAHLDEVERVLAAGGTIGKRLDFLMQELNREANTLGSKSVSKELSAAALEFKVLIAQMREQVQNLEDPPAPNSEKLTAPQRADRFNIRPFHAHPHARSPLHRHCPFSGAGKSSLVNAVLADDPALALSISYTTRAPRPGETNGAILRRPRGVPENAGRGEFLSAEVHGNFYATSQKRRQPSGRRAATWCSRSTGRAPSRCAASSPRRSASSSCPLSAELSRTAVARPRQGQRRCDPAPGLAAAETEMSHAGEFDYVIINNEFEEARRDLAVAVRASRLTLERQSARHPELVPLAYRGPTQGQRITAEDCLHRIPNRFRRSLRNLPGAAAAPAARR